MNLLTKSEWQTLADDERGKLRLEFNSGMAFLHLELRRPMEGLRAVRAGFPALKEMLRNRGYEKVNVIIPENDEKLHRFETMFGFRDVRCAGGQRLMSQEC